MGHAEVYTISDVLARYCADEGASRPPPHGVGRLRAPGRAVRHREQGPSARGRPVERRELQDAAALHRLLVRLVARILDDGPRLLPVDAVDLPEALRAGARVRGRGGRQLVPRARHRARQRRGDRRAERARRPSGRAPADAAVDAPDHGVRRPADRRPRRRRLARERQAHAAGVDRAQRGRRGALRGRGRRRRVRGLHDAPRHALRRDVLRARPRARAGRGDHDGGPSAPPSSRTPRPRRARASASACPPTRGRRPACSRARTRSTPRRGARVPDLRRRLRARVVRHGRDHGGARPRRARLGVRARARAPDRRGDLGWRRRRRPPTRATGPSSTAASSTVSTPRRRSAG